MIHISSILLACIILTVLLSLRSNRLMALVRLMAFQGVVVSAIPLFIENDHSLSLGIFLYFLLLVGVKGVIIPGLMARAVKSVITSREVEPIVSYHASLFFGLIILMSSVYITHYLRVAMLLPEEHYLLLVTAITTMGAGFILLMARRKAITQVIGYLMMENGIYLIGTALAKGVHSQYVVEFAVLLDLIVAILVMGIVIHNINNKFEDVDTTFLGQLKD